MKLVAPFLGTSRACGKLVSQLIMLLTTCAYTPSVAQSNRVVDSLQRQLNFPINKFNFSLHWEIAFELIDVDNERALYFANKAMTLAFRSGDSLSIAKSQRIIGMIFRRNSKLAESIAVLSTALKTTKNNGLTDESAKILNALAISHTFRSEYDLALRYHFDCLMLREKLDDKHGIGVTLNNIGLVYWKLTLADQALEYYSQALKVFEQLHEDNKIGPLLINIGLCYGSLHDFQSALSHIEKGMNSCEPACSASTMIEGEFALGAVYTDLHEFVKAKDHFLKSYAISVEEKNERFQLENAIQLIDIYIQEDQIVPAQELLLRIDSIPTRNEYGGLMMQVYQLAADLALKQLNYKEAERFRTRYIHYRDSLLGARTSESLRRVQVQFAERENLQRIEAQKKIVTLQEQAVQQHQSLNLALAGLVLLAAGLIFALYKINRQKQRINIVLDERVKERTRELEQNRDELRHLHEEKALELKTLSDELRGYLASFEGLYHLARKQTPTGKADEYVDEMWKASKKLSHAVKV